ncbi:MAG: hypothetical protein NC218_06290 [Acetobacter sp.]|nr:hypothetical protein [Acetobacter sp.]
MLHFNFIGLFGLCTGLICWSVFWSYPLVFAALCLGGFWFWRRAEFSMADGIFATAFMMNVWYISSSVGNVRQYDYFNFVMFIDYFIRNGFFLQAPMSFFQEIYYQPPLWGGVSAAVVRFCIWLGGTAAQGVDCVRYVNLFAVSGAGIIFWRLMERLKFQENVRFGLLALFCFFPANSILANLVNNDAMVYFLMLSAMYVGYLWYQSGRWREVFILSGILFAAGMIKFSGLMIVPAIGVLGGCLLLRAKNKLSLSLWGQFAVIGAGAVLGFSWGLFLMYFDLSLVSPPINVGFQDLNGFTKTERLFSFDTVSYPFADIWGGYIEVNVFLALVKTALFGEWGWALDIWAYLLYGLGLVLAVMLVMSFFSLWRYALGEDFALNIFCVVLVLSVLAAWMNFWLEYPYFCSSEFRYVAILLPVSLLWFGNYLSQKSLPKWLNYALAGCLVVFILAKFMLYLNTI